MNNQDCALCGQDTCDPGTIWVEDHIHKICKRCQYNLNRRFSAFFGVDVSLDDENIFLPWHQVKAILDKITPNTVLRAAYIVTDKELYERECLIKKPVTE